LKDWGGTRGIWKKNKLLIVDDIEMNRAILAQAFQKHSNKYEILEAENGKVAWDYIEKYGKSIAAILLDVIMPVMDGFQVLEKMSEDNLIKKIPVILITTEVMGDTVDRAYNMGVVDVIAKPFNPMFIQRRLDNTIELYRHREQLQEIVDEQTKILKEQSKELQETNTAIIETLSTAIEFRDCESGEHVKRIVS
jgi:putative two-component system response regulator